MSGGDDGCCAGADGGEGSRERHSTSVSLLILYMILFVLLLLVLVLIVSCLLGSVFAVVVQGAVAVDLSKKEGVWCMLSRSKLGRSSLADVADPSCSS